MILLTNGCKCSKLSVYPKDWESKKAKISFNWHIAYRFYDPNYNKPKQVMIKGMNQFNSLSERQLATQRALTAEMDRLTKEGYNPFSKLQKNPGGMPSINPQTSILESLNYVYAKIEVSNRTKTDIKHVLSSIGKAINLLGLRNFQISRVTRKTVKRILEKASNTPDRFNKNRSYLMILFSELCELELVETNPLRDIKKKKVVKHIRQVLTDEERRQVNEYLQNSYPEFHRFLHIFFHSGARISELLRLKEEDVDLKNQRYKMIIQKGREYREVWKTIKNIALPFWIDILQKTRKGEYLFSVALNPGTKQIQPYQITKRWYRLVKQKLGIEADFYSLKHLHTTEVVDLLSAEEAAKHNEHTSTAMVVGIYDVKRNARQHSKVKGLGNKFA